MSATEKPTCATCNPLPEPAITFDDCPECAAKNKQQMLAQFRAEQQHAALQGQLGTSALDRLVPVLSGRSGQSYKLRGILFSMWNGQPFSWNEIVSMDTDIRKDLSVLIVAWGHDGCFYTELQRAVTAAGQWHWFLEQAHEVEKMRNYVEAFDRRQRDEQ